MHVIGYGVWIVIWSKYVYIAPDIEYLIVGNVLSLIWYPLQAFVRLVWVIDIWHLWFFHFFLQVRLDKSYIYTRHNVGTLLNSMTNLYIHDMIKYLRVKPA